MGFSRKVRKEERVMKRLLVCTVIMAVVLTFGTFASATIYTFDFNSLTSGSGPEAISTYMTNIFGNSVVVSNYPVLSSASIIDPSSYLSRYTTVPTLVE